MMIDRSNESAPGVPNASVPAFFSWGGILTGLLVVAVAVASRPFTEIGREDDWSYVRTLQVLVHTGHIAYNGWATATLGWMLFWGVPFAKLFGSSYTVARLSILPLSFLSIHLFHACLRLIGITKHLAFFAAATYGLS